MFDESKMAGLQGLSQKYRGSDYSEVPEAGLPYEEHQSTLLQDLKNMENRGRVGRNEGGLWSTYDLPEKKGKIETDIGYGHKVTPEQKASGKIYGYDMNNIDDAAAEDILNQDKTLAREGLMRLLKRKGVDSELLSGEQLDGLTNMAYQMGPTGLGKFNDMFGGFKNFDNETIEREAWDSKWAKAHPTRAKEVISKLIKE